jgi:hypothetical protein
MRPFRGTQHVVVRDQGVAVEVSQRPTFGGAPFIALRWRVEVPAPGVPRFSVVPEGVRSMLAKLFGAQEVELGTYPAFDHAFYVKADDEATFRRRWTSRLVHLMTTQFWNAMLAGGGRRLVLRTSTSSPDADELTVPGAELVAELAHADVLGVAALRALPGATLRDAADGPFAAIEGPGEIGIGPRLVKRALRTRARAIAAWPQPVPTIEILDGQIDPTGQAALPAALHAVARALGTATLAASGAELSMTWPTIEEDAARLVAAIELLRGLVRAPAQGVFR